MSPLCCRYIAVMIWTQGIITDLVPVWMRKPLFEEPGESIREPEALQGRPSILRVSTCSSHCGMQQHIPSSSVPNPIDIVDLDRVYDKATTEQSFESHQSMELSESCQ
ncbi:hypothetical protein OSB04_018110 [Centaurea solstitialis]|uniref:Uncharacterized protein n=1 Tax=Centaurea solstitialis TaxID=347529 RepID=A0AA38TG04_9ASTR|nr:hypothetical protein OSB04_018110 [Centaurea solstitialis]